VKILITGATGFIGGAFLACLVGKPEYSIRIALRRPTRNIPFGGEPVVVEGLTPGAYWFDAVQGCDVIVHSAARVHVMDEKFVDPLQEFRLVNVEGTLNLACQAAAAGVKRFVFISSVKVNGEETILHRPYTENDAPAPEDPYGISKREAEDTLKDLALKTGMEVVIIRPPLVYGPGAQGNFQRLLYWVNKGIPLPFGAVNNKRSFISVANLVDLITICVEHPAAANQIFLAGDGEDLSTPELLRRVALALGKPSHVFPIPQDVLRWIALLLGKQKMIQRLCGSLQIDTGKARKVLGWTPPLTVDEGLRQAVTGKSFQDKAWPHETDI
jgi:nucleoside-diphosphate-sugar epimerase